MEDICDLVKAVEGRIVGNDEFFSIDGFTGRFTFLNDAHTGDIVVRHWINGTGIEMAFNKNIACLITQNPKDGAIEAADVVIMTDEPSKVSEGINLSKKNLKIVKENMPYHILYISIHQLQQI